MTWDRVLMEFHHFVKLDKPQDMLVLHVEGNDLGAFWDMLQHVGLCFRGY